MTNRITVFLCLFVFSLAFISCSSEDDPCTEVTWYQDMDEDGKGNPAVTKDSCDMPVGYVDNADDLNDQDRFFNYNLTIENPSSEEYKLGTDLPVKIVYFSESGEGIGFVEYTITNVETGYVLDSYSDQLTMSSSTFTVGVNNIPLTASDDVQANSTWIIEAKVASLFTPLTTQVTKSREFTIVE